MKSDDDPDVVKAYDIMSGRDELAYTFGAATERLRSLKYISGTGKSYARLEQARISAAKKLVKVQS